MSHPSEFTPTVVVRRRLRFKATALSAADAIASISVQDLWMMATAANAGNQLGDTFRIHAVEIWGPMAADLVPVTVSVEWTDPNLGAIGKSVRHSDTSMGSATPAHVRSVPPKTSQVSQWTNSSAGSLFTLAYPANAVVDFVYSLVLRDTAAATVVTGAVAGATVGALYVRALNSSVNNNLVPVSVATI